MRHSLRETCSFFSVLVLDRLKDDDIRKIINKALQRLCLAAASPTPPDLPPSMNDPPTQPTNVTPAILDSITHLSYGDARTALGLVELVITSPAGTQEEIILESLKRSVSTR